MNGFWSVFRREIDERRLLLAGALLLGGLPFAAAVLPQIAGRDLSHSRLAVAIVLALVATGVTALALGATVIARDVAERRIGFYFQRPLSGWAIWGGKISAAAALSLTTGALIAMPAVLADLSQLGSPRDPSLTPLAALGGGLLAALLIVLGLTHAGSILLRARSPWLLLDLAGVMLIGGALFYGDARLVRAGILGYGNRSVGLDCRDYGSLGIAAAVLVASLAAGAAQVLTARTDLRRGHGVLSRVFWAGMLAAALLFSGFTRWVIDVTPRDLRSILRADGPPAGSWIALQGEAAHRPGYAPWFLADTASRRFLHLSAGVAALRISDDGRRAVWLEAQGGNHAPPHAVVFADLTVPAPRPMPTVLSFAAPPSALALSPRGDRLAVVEGHRLSLYQLPGGRILAAAVLPPAPYWLRRLRFVGPERVRVYQGGDERWPLRLGMTYEVFDLSEDRAGLVKRSRFEQVADWPRFEVSPDGRYLFSQVGGRPVLLDVEAGREVADLTPAEPGARLGQLAFLADGRLAAIEIAGKVRRLVLRDPSFRLERTFPLPWNHPVLLGGLLSPGTLVVARVGADVFSPPRGFDSFEVDLATGALSPLGRNLAPLTAKLWAEGTLANASPELFLRGHGLVRLDPRTGKEIVIVPTGSAG